MSKKDLIQLLIENQRIAIFFFCVLFGVVAQESYQILKNENTSFKKFLPKSIVALFVCMMVSGFLQENELLNKFYPFVIMAMAFLHRPASDWMMTDLLPFLSNQLVKGQKNKKEDE